MQCRRQSRRNERRAVWAFLVIGVLVVCFSAVPPAQAVDYTWLTATGGYFHDADNWSGVGWPDDSTDKAIFNQAGTYTVWFDSQDYSLITNKQLEVVAGTVDFTLCAAIVARHYVLCSNSQATPTSCG